MINLQRKQLFSHTSFEKYNFENIPLDRDIFLMDEKWMTEYHDAFVKFFDGENVDTSVGYIGFASVGAIGASTIELSWYPNTSDRFHEVKVSLSREDFIICVASPQCDEKPHLFVKSQWLENLHHRTYPVFCTIDAIGVKKALANGSLTREKLIRLRDCIDDIAKRYPAIAFISFADSLLIKGNWSVGTYDSEIKYTYKPEVFIKLILEVQSIYRDILQMEIYAILTQGNNEYYDDGLLHISEIGNHVSLNSLGIPFTQLMSIDTTVRKALKNNFHPPKELYMDEDFYRSLRFDYSFAKNAKPNHPYNHPMTTRGSLYFYEDLNIILENLSKS